MTLIVACKNVLPSQLGRLEAGQSQDQSRNGMKFTLQINGRGNMENLTGQNIMNIWDPSPRLCFYKDLAAVVLKKKKKIKGNEKHDLNR